MLRGLPSQPPRLTADNVPDMIERVWLHGNKSDYNDLVKRYEKDLKFGKVLDSGQIERMKLLLFIFRANHFY